LCDKAKERSAKNSTMAEEVNAGGDFNNASLLIYFPLYYPENPLLLLDKETKIRAGLRPI